MAKKKTKLVIEKHILMPKHTILSDAQKAAVLKKYNARPSDLPKILMSDPAIVNMVPKIGDIIKIERNDPIIGTTTFYRVVINE